MKLCSYVVKYDTGLAPNPFHGWCTSAVCTPSHMNASLQEGDWLIGHSPRDEGNQLIYAMRLTEKSLTMEEYFDDPRFEAKKPDLHGDAAQQCGDNLYYRDDNGQWVRLPSRFHNKSENFIKDVGTDLKGRPVFVSQDFYYFGKNRVDIYNDLRGVIKDKQGIKYTEGTLAEAFVTWLENNHKGHRNPPSNNLVRPKDFPHRCTQETGSLLTGLFTVWEDDVPGQDKNLADPAGQSNSQPIPKSKRSNCRC